MVFLFPLLLAGCDNFSLPGQFGGSGQTGQSGPTGPSSPPGSFSLVLTPTTVHPGESSTLSPQGGSAPYTATVAALSLYNDSVHADAPGSIQNLVYTAGNSIGTVQITVSDSAGHSTNATITVIPKAPLQSSFTATGATKAPWQVTLAWAYSEPGYISGFILSSSTAADGTFTQIATVAIGANLIFIDKPSPPNQTYYYRLSAVAGTQYVSDSYVTANAMAKN